MMGKSQIVVLGMHRSGTSLLALILKELGVNMGEKTLEGTSSNPYGHEEDIEFLRINQNMLRAMGGSWDFPPREDVIAKKISRFSDTIQNIIEQRDSNNMIWGWKEPRTTLLMEAYSKYLNNPKYICMYRNVEDVAKSLKKRNMMPVSKGISLANEYNERMEKFLQSVEKSNIMKISFEEMNQNSTEVIYELIDFLDINPDSKQIENAIKIFKPLNIVRSKGSELKKDELRMKLLKAIRHPVKAVYILANRYVKVIRYHLGRH